MNIKVNKKMARLLVLRILLKEIISTKQVSYLLLFVKRKKATIFDSLFLFIFKIQRYLVFLGME